MSKVLSCYWFVSINGKELDSNRKECIDSISVEEQCDGSDTCTLVVNDPDFLFIEDNIFVEEVAVSVRMGWHGDTHRVSFDGYISAIDIQFPDTGFPTLSIYCLDTSHVMNRTKKTRTWDNVTRPQVVQAIAKEYGFQCVIQQGYTYDVEDTISQSNTTDIEFCESLAGEEREPFMCKLIGKTLYYVKKGLLKDPSATLYYKAFPFDVVSFTPKINKETRQEEVAVADINTNTKTVDSATSNSSNTSRDVQGAPVKTSSSQTSYRFDPRNTTWKQEVK